MEAWIEILVEGGDDIDIAKSPPIVEAWIEISYGRRSYRNNKGRLP